VHLLGVGATSLSRRPREPRPLAREAVAAALADAGVSPGEVDGVAIAASDPGFDRGCFDVLGEERRAYRCRCGLGAVALHSAWNAVSAGASEIVLCVGHDPPPGLDLPQGGERRPGSDPWQGDERRQGGDPRQGGERQQGNDPWHGGERQQGGDPWPGGERQQGGDPREGGDPRQGGERAAGSERLQAEIDSQAAAAREYMQYSGATETHLARVAAKNRRHGAANPHAQLSAAVDSDEVLASEMLVWPLRRLMVAAPAQGAAAIVLASHAAGRRRGPKAPRILSSVLLDEDSRGGASPSRAARLAYFSAGIGPEEIDLAEIEDPTPVDELAAYEALELAPEGSGPELVDSGFTALGGVVPVNASGGSLSQGHARGAGGILQLVELSLQLCDRAGPRQVPGARLGLSLAGSATTPGKVTALTILGT
jgi:acetyl-CoA acetyltransferase